jgi:hypothetical protein
MCWWTGKEVAVAYFTVQRLHNPKRDTKTILTDEDIDTVGVFGIYFKLLSQNLLIWNIPPSFIMAWLSAEIQIQYYQLPQTYETKYNKKIIFAPQVECRTTTIYFMDAWNSHWKFLVVNIHLQKSYLNCGMITERYICISVPITSLTNNITKNTLTFNETSQMQVSNWKRPGTQLHYKYPVCAWTNQMYRFCE